MTWALNHLNYFVLTNELLDMLKASAPSRIVNVSSDAHQGSSLNLQDVEFEQGYGQGWRPYAHSKLANVMFTYELARRLKDTGVTANALHPGFVATRFGLNNGTLMNLVMKSMPSRDYSGPWQSRAIRDTDIAGRLWDLSLDMI